VRCRFKSVDVFRRSQHRSLVAFMLLVLYADFCAVSSINMEVDLLRKVLNIVHAACFAGSMALDFYFVLDASEFADTRGARSAGSQRYNDVDLVRLPASAPYSQHELSHSL
jgi:hypothetical protein